MGTGRHSGSATREDGPCACVRLGGEGYHTQEACYNVIGVAHTGRHVYG